MAHSRRRSRSNSRGKDSRRIRRQHRSSSSSSSSSSSRDGANNSSKDTAKKASRRKEQRRSNAGRKHSGRSRSNSSTNSSTAGSIGSGNSRDRGKRRKRRSRGRSQSKRYSRSVSLSTGGSGSSNSGGGDSSVDVKRRSKRKHKKHHGNNNQRKTKRRKKSRRRDVAGVDEGKKTRENTDRRISKEKGKGKREESRSRISSKKSKATKHRSEKRKFREREPHLRASAATGGIATTEGISASAESPPFSNAMSNSATSVSQKTTPAKAILDAMDGPGSEKDRGVRAAEGVAKAKVMVPMRPEEYEAQQKIVREIFDEDTGRWRLIKGTGEIIERIVSRKEQQEIQQHASRWGWDHKTLSQGEASSSGGVGIGGAWVRGKN